MDIKEESLKRALTENRLYELPKQLKGDNGEYWLEALILVRKRDGSQSYASGKRGADGKIVYTSDFGTMSTIFGILSIHPYIFLDKKKYMPYETIEQKRYALTKYIGGDEDAKKAVSLLSDDEVCSQILEIAINAQYASKRVQNTHDAIIKSVKGNSETRDGIIPTKRQTTNDNGIENNKKQYINTKNKAGRPKKLTQK